jgi:amidase
MPFRPPSRSEIESIGLEFGLDFDAEDIERFRGLATPMIAGTAFLDTLPEALPAVRYPRTPGRFPSPDENPLGAWYVKSRVEGAAEGPLAGRSVVLKDNVMLAGVPMMNGTRLLEGFVPPVDATVATRILDAGGTIEGKAVCEAFCLSAGSHTSESGPVRNPHDPTRTSGGSSSGSAALVASGEVDMAIGGDQGGSIRIPASYCGIVGMKATHGLVPYTGILSMDATLDHTGPMTQKIADNALLLEVIAGADGLDGRQAAPRTDAYSEALGQGVDGLRIALLREGFDNPLGDARVSDKVRSAAARFEAQGAKLSEVSIPGHLTAGAFFAPILQAGMIQMLHTDGMGAGREDLYVTALADRMHGWRQRADQLPDTVKTILLATEVLRRRYGFRYYAKAMNAVRGLRAAYDAVLAEADVLLMPTTVQVAPLLPNPGEDEDLGASFAHIANTQPFDHTHHPAMSMPCGKLDELPVGMMLVGRAHEEALLYKAGDAFERSGDWREM